MIDSDLLGKLAKKQPGRWGKTCDQSHMQTALHDSTPIAVISSCGNQDWFQEPSQTRHCSQCYLCLWQWNIPTFDLYLMCTIYMHIYFTCLVTSFSTLLKVNTHASVCTLHVDAARELEEGERKKKPNCFALGPLFDNFAKRTYYISCGEFLLFPVHQNADHDLKECQWRHLYLAKIKFNPWLIFISSLSLALEHRYILSFISAGMWSKSQKNWMLSGATLSLKRISCLNNYQWLLVALCIGLSTKLYTVK